MPLPCLTADEERMLEHFGISAEEVLHVERLQECRSDDDVCGTGEYPDFVLAPVEVDARLSAHGGVNHGKERCGDIDEAYAALEDAGGKASEVGDHPTTHINEQRVACASQRREPAEDVEQRFGILRLLAGREGMALHGFRHKTRQAMMCGMSVGEEEHLVGLNTGDDVRQCGVRGGRIDDFLHSCMALYIIYK